MGSKDSDSHGSRLIWLKRMFQRRLTLRSLTIAIPLVVAICFSLGFTEYRSVTLHQQSVEARRAKQIDRAASQSPELPLLALPAVPELKTGSVDNAQASPPIDEAPQSNTASNAMTPATGPSPRNAARTLQAVNDEVGNDKNSQLQATRKDIKIDQLDL